MMNEIENTIKKYFPNTHHWDSLQYDTGASDENMSEALQEILDLATYDIYDDLEIILESWIERHGNRIVSLMIPELERLMLHDRKEYDDS